MVLGVGVGNFKIRNKDDGEYFRRHEYNLDNNGSSNEDSSVNIDGGDNNWENAAIFVPLDLDLDLSLTIVQASVTVWVMS